MIFNIIIVIITTITHGSYDKELLKNFEGKPKDFSESWKIKFNKIKSVKQTCHVNVHAIKVQKIVKIKQFASKIEFTRGSCVTIQCKWDDPIQFFCSEIHGQINTNKSLFRV